MLKIEINYRRIIMELADKKIKNVVYGGREADLNRKVDANDLRSVAKAFGAELRNDSQKTLSSVMMARQAGSLSY